MRDAGRMIRVGGVSDCLYALYSSDWLDFGHAPPPLALHKWKEYDHGGTVTNDKISQTSHTSSKWVYLHLLRI